MSTTNVEKGRGKATRTGGASNNEQPSTDGSGVKEYTEAVVDKVFHVAPEEIMMFDKPAKKTYELFQ